MCRKEGICVCEFHLLEVCREIRKKRGAFLGECLMKGEMGYEAHAERHGLFDGKRRFLAALEMTRGVK